MNSWCKLSSKILDSTIWGESAATRVVWITMLAWKDPTGLVESTVPGLARRAMVSLEECETALAKFLAPDPYSSTKDHEGRRIQAVEGGWVVLNHFKYRDEATTRRDYKRIWMREKRQKKKKMWLGTPKTMEEKVQENGGDVI